MKRKVLLISPGYYEVGDYGYSIQPPMGLFKIARYFINKGIDIEYIDCGLPIRIADTNINTKNHFIDAPFVKYLPCGNYENEGIVKAQRYYGIPHRIIRERIKAANPTEIWVSTGLTYYWESVKEIVDICKEIFPKVPVLIGGIYASLYPQHAQKMVDADYIQIGALEDIDGLMPYYDIDSAYKSIRTIQISKGCNVFPPCSFCFSKGTPIKTNNGWINIENLKIGTLVETTGGKFEPVIAELSRDYTGKMYKIYVDGSNIPIEVTTDHKFPTQRGEVKAAELLVNDSIELPIPAKTDNHKLNKHIARLLGYYVSEGSIGKDRKGEPCSIVFTFNHNEVEYINDVYWLVKELYSKECRLSDTGTASQVTFSSKAIASNFVSYGGIKAGGKKLPRVILECPNINIINQFLKGLYRGDGSVFITESGYRVSYTTISFDLAWDLWRLLRSIGYNARLSKERSTTDTIQGRKVNVAEYKYQIIIHNQEQVFQFCDEILEEHLDPIPSYHFTKAESIYIQNWYKDGPKSRGFVKKLRELMGWGKATWHNIKYKTFIPMESRLIISDITSYDYSGIVYNCTVDPSHLVTTPIGVVNQCAVVSMDTKFSPLNEDKVFEYIKEEYKKGATQWQVWASQLLVPPYRFIALLNKIIASDMKINLIASEGVQPSLMTQQIADLMLKAGFAAISIPMESIKESTTDSWNKPSTFKDYENAVLYAQKAGFKYIKSFVMVGVPGQTYDEMIQSIVNCWARDTVIAFHQYTPVPAAPDWYYDSHKKYHDMSPELLHPSLWPGASNDLKVEYLEEIKKIVKIGFRGYIKYKDSNIVKVPEIWELFHKWCKIYELVKNDNPTNIFPLALKGYTSGYTDYFNSTALNEYNRKTNKEACR